MKKIISTLFICILLFSCKKEEETSYTIKIINNSDYLVSIAPYNIFFVGYYNDSIRLIPLGVELIEDTRRGLKGPINNSHWFFGDSIKVTYNDTLSIYHGSISYNVSRNIMNVNSFQHEDKSEKKYLENHHYSYTFTNADFEEAKTK